MESLARLKVYNSSDESDCSSEEESKPDKMERLPVPHFEISSPLVPILNTVREDGRIRNFPHEPGNWATYVYFPVSSTELTTFLEDLTDFVEPLNLKIVDDFHVSLTKTVVLKHHWIQDFTQSVKNSLSNIKTFKIHLCGLKTYCNEQKTRTFLSLKVVDGEDKLREIVHQLDHCLKEYNLECFYKNPSFHLSLFWCVGDFTKEVNEFLKLIPEKLETFNLSIKVSHCVCASGNKKFTFNFS